MKALSSLKMPSSSGRRNQGIWPVTQQSLDHEHDGPDNRQFGACANKEKSFANSPVVCRTCYQRQRVKCDPTRPDTWYQQDGTENLGRNAVPRCDGRIFVRCKV